MGRARGYWGEWGLGRVGLGRVDIGVVQEFVFESDTRVSFVLRRI